MQVVVVCTFEGSEDFHNRSVLFTLQVEMTFPPES